MNAPTITLPHRYRAIPIERLRSLFGGMGFLLAVAAMGTVCWTVQYVLVRAPAAGIAQALRQALPVLELNLTTTMLPAPICAVLLNLAPPSGLRRLAHYALAVIVCLVWCLCHDPNGMINEHWLDAVVHDRPLLADACDAAASLTVLLIAFGYYRTAANASDVLSRTHVDAARLDNELQSARLQLLQAQIEPHFLLNTIANVRTLARLQPAAATGFIDNLGRYFAAALPHIRESEACLGDEMRLADAYLAIYRVRMGTRLSYAIDLPPELAPVRVPTMILLTLVENAVKHGITPAVEGGFIRVSAACEQSVLQLKVADSGCGLKPGLGAGSGLANCRSRLRLRYGSPATLHLERAEPRGVIATVRIPMARLA